MPTPPIKKDRFESLLKQYTDLRGPERAWEEIANECGYRKGASLKNALDSGSKLYNIKLPKRRYETMSQDERRSVVAQISGDAQPTPTVTLPKFQSPDAPIDELLSILSKDSQRRIEYHDAKQWATIQVNVSGPYGLWFWGDPHLDDDGCAHHILQDHVRLIKENPCMLSVGMGDYQNNWIGRLSRLYANQETSARTAWRLVEWWIKEVRPVLMLKGNHDLWSGSGDPLNWMIKQSETMSEDWQAQVQFESPNGQMVRLWAAHDFPGNSMWNPLHAQQRKAVTSGARAHIYVSGHRHTWGAAVHEDPESNHVYCLLRARGYKVLDKHAEQLGFGSQRYGNSVVVIVNPDAENPSQLVTPFADPVSANNYLMWLRSR